MRKSYVGWLMLVGVVGCKKPPETSIVPKTGWVEVAAGKSCYFPPEFASMNMTDRRLARQKALEAMISQWSGSRNDGISFEDAVVENVETALLGRPERIEEIAERNAVACQAALTSGSTSEWTSWISGVPSTLSQNECNPLLDRWFSYFDISTGWQSRAPVCKGNTVEVKISSIDYYRIVDGGEWINAEGDKTKSALGTSLPCNTEGCFVGQIVLKFTGRSGVVVVAPVGLGTVYTPPEHGTIEVGINDDTFYDNKYKVESGMEHHASVEYSPR